MISSMEHIDPRNDNDQNLILFFVLSCTFSFNSHEREVHFGRLVMRDSVWVRES